MRLLEVQAKDILAYEGFQVPTGILIEDGNALSSNMPTFGGSVYVKAQVPYGNRAAEGLVVQTSPDGIGEAIANMAMPGIKVPYLVEEKVIGELGYISVRVDEVERRRQIVVATRGGGSGFNPSTGGIVVGATPGSAIWKEILGARMLANKVPAADVARWVELAERVLAISKAWHAYVVEINPIAITSHGFIPLDAKIELDDYSRHLVPNPEILSRFDSRTQRERLAEDCQALDHRGSLRYVQLVSEEADRRSARFVGTHSIGGGESMVVFDALHSAGLVPTNYCDTSGAPSQEKVALAAELISSQRNIRGYFFASCIASQPLTTTARGLIEGWARSDWRGPTVARIAGNEEKEAGEIIGKWLDEREIPHAILDRSEDEWAAAHAMVELLDEDG